MRTCLRSIAGVLAVLSLSGCVRRPAGGISRAEMLGISRTDLVEQAVEREAPRRRLVLVFWPKPGACGACAAGAHDALASFTERFSDAALILVWPHGLPLPPSSKIPRAEVVLLSPEAYKVQMGVLSAPRLEAWTKDRLLGLQTLDERRTGQDFVELLLDDYRGLT